MKTSQREDAKYKLAEQAAAFILGPFIAAWLFLWYNYILIQWPIGYWNCVAFAFAWWLVPSWITKPVTSLVFSACIIAQVIKWMGFIQFPLFHQ